ncbi:hypothetical protein ROA7450_02193 [Roseovarius albus]|uniref:DUF1826 domain-containing protein n=1 Tax=Roseovarius albus TaxID=1247867 RepID=A0A1X6ZAL5_9RHOB|nr:DUF1826 domain-containing protein [Roseovarius albus]SLN45419.1 hypothetical protein ROA7450_02193 [Roseovarius albus]
MNLVHKVAQDTFDGVAIVETPEELVNIHRLGCSAAIWRRTPLHEFQTWIDTLEADVLPTARMILKPERVHAALVDLIHICGTPDCRECHMLSGDIAAMAALFAEVMGVDYLRLNLGAPLNCDLRGFHVDAVTARLVCTYRGAGTQYGKSVRGREPESYSNVPTGSPIILRGKLWPKPSATNILYRTPPFQDPNETRLQLVLEPVMDLEVGPANTPKTIH